MEYANALVTFVDILGFREIVSKRTAGEIAYILSWLIRTAKPFGFNARPGDVSFVNFSDNVVRISALPKRPRYRDIVPRLWIEASDLAGAQALLSQRGGVHSGWYMHGEDCT
jgi:hypothetical protein